jgi:hypothetical protein
MGYVSFWIAAPQKKGPAAGLIDRGKAGEIKENIDSLRLGPI